MATTSENESIEDISEDLELHQALLQSLVETRPNAIEERKELQDTVMNLERKLAQRRGVPYHDPSSQAPQTPRRPLQFDGTESASPARHTVNNPNGNSPRPPQQQHTLSVRKRLGRPDDFANPSEPPSLKRIRSENFDPLPVSRLSRDSPQSNSSRNRTHDRDRDTDPLMDFLDLDDDAMQNFEADQIEAERWLENRRAQERRDEEFARRLQQRLDEELSYAPPLQSHESQAPQLEPGRPLTITEKITTTTNYRPVKGFPPPNRHYSHQAFPIPDLDVHTTQQRRPSYAPSPLPANPGKYTYMQQGPSSSDTDAQDSSDNDFAEISSSAFYKKHPSIKTSGSSSRHSSVHPGYPPAMYIPGDLLRPSSLTPTYPSQLLNRGYPASTHPYGPIYGLGLKDRPEFPIINTGSYSGFGSPAASLYDDEYTDNKQATKELNELLENIRPDLGSSKNKCEDTPKQLKCQLYEHQKLGLAWMKSMEEGTNKGGILADDMGLGKTVQALSLIVSRPSDDPARKTTLIIAPVGLMQQWKREIDRLLKPEHKLSVLVLHGDRRKITFENLKRHDVVLTTFGTMSSEFKRRTEWDEQRRFASQNEANMLKDASSLILLGPRSTWHRVIIDEAQCIKNRNTKSAIACCALNSTYRWCMSGTPMMNGVHELHSLIRFLRIRPYNSLERFNVTFTRPLKSPSRDDQQKALQQLRALLSAILLRRTKTSKSPIDGKPLLNLPPRVTEKVHAVFSEEEQELYTSLENRTQIKFNRYLEAGSVGRNYSNILVLLLRLRQACCHPHLINDLSVDISAVTESADFIENAKQFSPDVVRRLKENEPLECPVCIDAVENAVIFYPCGHATCAECFARISDPALALQQGNEGQVEAKCPNCRGKIDPKKVTDHLSFKKVYSPSEVTSTDDQQASAANKASEESDSDEESDDDNDQDDGPDSSSDLGDFIVNDDSDLEDTPPRKIKVKFGPKNQNKGKSKEDKKPKKTLAILRKEGQRNTAAKRKYFKRLEKRWEPSAKIEKAIEILQDIKNSGSGEKTIIFSQFTSLLDLLEVPIHRRGWKYRRYDGSMRPADRNQSVLDFTDDPECDIMLVSLKAGNSGLNLVAASQVIIFDPFWNPYIEEQAIDRAHRLGQTRPVQVHRILIEKTVEDRILMLQDQKREIIEGALDENAAKNISRLGVRELKFLFNIR